MAELKVEASNFAYFDYYEPLEFNLIANEGYSSYNFQLKIMFQLVKPTSISSASLNVLVAHSSDW